MPGSRMSATYVPWPLTSVRVGRPGTDWPTYFIARPRWDSSRRAPAPQVLRRRLDRLDDELVARAPTEVARDPAADLRLAGSGIVGQQLQRGEHHAGRTIPALQTLVLHERLLNRVQLLRAGAQPLDGRDLAPVGVRRENAARLHRLPVHHHRARPAAPRPTADVGPRQPQLLPEHVRQDHPGVDLQPVGLLVDRDLHWRLHAALPSRAAAPPAVSSPAPPPRGWCAARTRAPSPGGTSMFRAWRNGTTPPRAKRHRRTSNRCREDWPREVRATGRPPPLGPRWCETRMNRRRPPRPA